MRRASASVRRGALLACVVSFVACAHAPRPAVFARVDEQRATAMPAREGSPALWAKAEGLRRRADDAFQHGDTATAELLAEQARAAYAHALVTARLSAAVVRQSKVATELTKASEQLEADEKSRVEVDREADRLEADIAIRREALAPAASAKTDGAREAARWVATRANLSVADALCTGATLLAPKAKGVEEARKVLSEVTAKSKDAKGEAPIDASTRVRALCLKALSTARTVVVASGGPAGDELLEELGKGGFSATRDERGVVATLPMVPAKDAPFDGGTAKLTAAGKDRLEALGRVAKAHPTFAVVIVVHAAPGAINAARDTGRADAAKHAVAAAGVDLAKIGVSTPGASLPAFPPSGENKSKNERVEVVFVGGS